MKEGKKNNNTLADGFLCQKDLTQSFLVAKVQRMWVAQLIS